MGSLPKNTPRVCAHKPRCPAPTAPDHGAARVKAHLPDQGYALLCNGVVRMEDTGEVLPNGDVVAPHRIPLIAAGARPLTR
ncbi:DUF5999 family protein [Streptomyces cyaneofuscatus]|uniref:DUF5999 family protein n=1 Tax=Streptomyces cyaneofuscatus TaxID=66883 RepID=UPI00382A5896